MSEKRLPNDLAARGSSQPFPLGANRATPVVFGVDPGQLRRFNQPKPRLVSPVAMPPEDSGQPIEDLPPIIEFGEPEGFGEPEPVPAESETAHPHPEAPAPAEAREASHDRSTLSPELVPEQGPAPETDAGQAAAFAELEPVEAPHQETAPEARGVSEPETARWAAPENLGPPSTEDKPAAHEGVEAPPEPTPDATTEPMIFGFRPERRSFLAPVGGEEGQPPRPRPRLVVPPAEPVEIPEAPGVHAERLRDAAAPLAADATEEPAGEWTVPGVAQPVRVRTRPRSGLRRFATGPVAVVGVVLLVALIVLASIEFLHPFQSSTRKPAGAPTQSGSAPATPNAAATPPANNAANNPAGTPSPATGSVPGSGAPAAPNLPAAGAPAAPGTDAAAQRVADTLSRAKAGDSAAQLEAAILYAKGDGVAQDYGTAATWFRAAAEQGVPRAQYDLGVLYERGRGVTQDSVQAFSWYKKAAESNFALAQYNLAVAYTKGEGTTQDYAQAANWYRRAAQQGVIPAMVNLAILYERGEGLSASAVDAYGWYRAAAHRGNQAAAKRSEELLRAFAPADQSRAEAKATEVQSSIKDAVSERAATSQQSSDSGPVLKPGVTAGALRSQGKTATP